MTGESSMNTLRLFHRSLLILLLIFTVLPALSHAQEVGEHVIKRGVVDDDLYLAGGQVDLYATVNGDVVVAGGQLNLEGDISADVIAAGGSVALRGSVGDDARLAGGEVRVAARVGDDLVAAGGRIHLSPIASIGGRAWLSGGDIRIDGQVADELRVSGGRVVITGAVNGNVELRADDIIIEETAVISGNLHYKSSHEASIAEGARIDGEVRHTPIELDMKPVVASVIFAGLVLLFSIILTAVVLYLLFPDYCLRVSQTLHDQPWQALAIGLAVFAGVPLLVIILFSTAVGVWLALMLLVIYLVMLLVGYFAGAFYVGNAGLNMLGKTEVSKTLRAIALAVAIFSLAVINLVPLLGSLANWLVLLAGLGALSRQLYLGYRV
jgi:cytoskeletal protein CcmA (bactofilin family)